MLFQFIYEAVFNLSECAGCALNEDSIHLSVHKIK